MALTKVSRGLLSTGIVDNSNATAITLNDDESATFANRVGIGVAAHSSDALNITTTNQHIRLNNGSELGIVALTSDGDLDFWAHGADEKINFRTGTGSGTVAMNVVGTKVGIGRIPRVGLDVAGEVAIAYDANYGLRFYNQPQNNWAFIGNDVTTSSADLRLGDSTGEVMRLTGGNTIFGTTNFAPVSNNVQGISIRNFGELQCSRDGGATLYLNRKTNDGDIVILRKDGADIGSIGVSGTNNVYISGEASNHAGLTFATDAILPTRQGATTDDVTDLGASSERFDNIFASNGTINTSDRNEKQDIEELSDAEKRVAVAAKGLLRKYRWKSAVEEKGDDARIHVGIVAQDLKASFEAEGLDAGRYAMFCSDTWTNDDGSEQTRLGVRYSELLAFIIAAI